MDHQLARFEGDDGRSGFIRDRVGADVAPALLR